MVRLGWQEMGTYYFGANAFCEVEEREEQGETFQKEDGVGDHCCRVLWTSGVGSNCEVAATALRSQGTSYMFSLRTTWKARRT